VGNYHKLHFDATHERMEEKFMHPTIPIVKEIMDNVTI
jgi:hypothetical protein